MASGAAMQEYLISLGVKADWSNVNKVMNFLNSGTLKTAAFGTALVAAGKAMYNFIKTNVEAEQSFAALARTQNKSLETVRAEQNALKAMGKTMSEVSKDPALKTIYSDIVKVNKSLALPDMKGAMAMISQLQGAFYELKSVISYATQWINYHILANLQEPIQRITEYLKKISDFIRKDMNGFSSKIAAYMTAFSKGLLGIVELGVKIAEWIHKLPSGIKAAGTAIVGVFALLKSGPLGQIMAVITAIGGLIDDYENFQWNKTAPEGEKVDVAFGGIWEILDSDDPDKMSKVVEKVTTALGAGISSFSIDLEAWVENNKEDIISAGTKIAEFLGEAIKGVVDIGVLLIEALVSLLTNESFLDACDNLAMAIVSAIQNAFSGLSDSLFLPFMNWWSDWINSWPDWLKNFLGLGSDEMMDFVKQDMEENGYLYDSETGKKLTNEEALQLYMTDSAAYAAARDPERTKVDKKRSELGTADFFEFGEGMSPGTDSTKMYQQLMQNFNNATTMDEMMYWYNAVNESKGKWNSGRKSGLLGKFQQGSDTEADTIAMMQGFLDNPLYNPDVQSLVTERNANVNTASFQQSVQDALSGTSELTWETGEPTVPSDAGTNVIKQVQQQVDSSGKKVEVSVGSKHGGSVGATFGNAWGGRYNHPITTEVAEDGGTEYIIPLNKPARALSLIKQMFSEMGGVATNQVMKDLGLGMEGTVGSSAASISAMAGSSNISNSYNISAPVTIQVTASGSDAKAIGTAAYSAAERQLIRSLKGVLA